MTRLEKKCFIAASGTHGLLLVILVVGPAFFSPKDRVQPAQLISVISGKVVDDALTSGGSAVALPPPPTQQQEPTPPAPPVHNDPPKHDVTPPEPPKHEPKPDKSLEPEPKPPKHVTKLTQDELKLVKPKNNNNNSQTKEREQREAEAQHQRDLANQRAAVIKSSLRSLDGKVGRAVATDVGPVGNGGEAMVNYRDIVASKYTIAWAPPANLDDENAAVTVSVVIARDGRVIHSKIIRPSGNPAMDKSIDSLLDNVTFIEPFPKSSDDAQRTFTIKFNLQAKRGLG